MYWFSLLFFSLFNVYELKYFVKYWKTGKPLRTTACVADALKRVYKLFRSGGYCWEFLVGVFQTKKCNFPRPFQTWPLGRNHVIIT